MKRRDNAILLGIGTTRRKFVPIDSNPVGLTVKIPARKYQAKESGKLCRGIGNHKCLFNKDDTLSILCPETVMDEDDLATVFIHREWNGKDMLMQRNFKDYINLLEFKEECVLEFPVLQIGCLTYGRRDEFLCIQPAPGTNLWVDKRLTLSCEIAKTSEPGTETETQESKAAEDTGLKMEVEMNEGLSLYDEINDNWEFDGYSLYSSFYEDEIFHT